MSVLTHKHRKRHYKISWQYTATSYRGRYSRLVPWLLNFTLIVNKILFRSNIPSVPANWSSLSFLYFIISGHLKTSNHIASFSNSVLLKSKLVKNRLLTSRCDFFDKIFQLGIGNLGVINYWSNNWRLRNGSLVVLFMVFPIQVYSMDST